MIRTLVRYRAAIRTALPYLLTLACLLVAWVYISHERAVNERQEKQRFEQARAAAVQRAPQEAAAATTAPWTEEEQAQAQAKWDAAEQKRLLDQARNAPTPPPGPPKSAAGSSSGSSQSIAIGGEGRLTMSGGGLVPVAATRAALDEIIKCSTRGDVYGLANLEAAGLLYWVEDGTRILVLDYAGFLSCEAQVRILEGGHTSLSGWVPNEMVVP